MIFHYLLQKKEFRPHPRKILNFINNHKYFHICSTPSSIVFAKYLTHYSHFGILFSINKSWIEMWPRVASIWVGYYWDELCQPNTFRNIILKKCILSRKVINKNNWFSECICQ
eukprot:NODE_894_length_3242_cov_0.893732.p1 type:complete len:113 gc:universal NODE_894_length_3242_cov_0.893732:2885-3223(+)